MGRKTKATYEIDEGLHNDAATAGAATLCTGKKKVTVNAIRHLTIIAQPTMWVHNCQRTM